MSTLGNKKEWKKKGWCFPFWFPIIELNLTRCIWFFLAKNHASPSCLSSYTAGVCFSPPLKLSTTSFFIRSAPCWGLKSQKLPQPWKVSNTTETQRDRSWNLSIYVQAQTFGVHLLPLASGPQQASKITHQILPQPSWALASVSLHRHPVSCQAPSWPFRS